MASPTPEAHAPSRLARLPFFYGWIVVAVAFITMGIGVNTRTAVVGAIPAELFQSKHYGSIFGTLSMSAGLGAAGAPWIIGVMYDRFGSYAPAWWLALGVSVFSILCIWCAAPRRVRAVAGRIGRLQARQRER